MGAVHHKWCRGWTHQDPTVGTHRKASMRNIGSCLGQHPCTTGLSEGGLDQDRMESIGWRQGD